MTDIKTLDSLMLRIEKAVNGSDEAYEQAKQALNLYIEEKIKEQFVDKVKPYASKKSKEAFVSGYLQGFRDCNLGRVNKYEPQDRIKELEDERSTRP